LAGGLAPALVVCVCSPASATASCSTPSAGFARSRNHAKTADSPGTPLGFGRRSAGRMVAFNRMGGRGPDGHAGRGRAPRPLLPGNGQITGDTGPPGVGRSTDRADFDHGRATVLGGPGCNGLKCRRLLHWIEGASCRFSIVLISGLNGAATPPHHSRFPKLGLKVGMVEG